MKYVIALIFSIIGFNLIVSLFSPAVQASTMLDKPSLELNDQNQAFILNTRQEAVAYFALPTNIDLENISSVMQQIGTYSTETIPNFDQHPHYGLYIELGNHTQTSHWILHLNRFLIDKIAIYVVTEHGNSYIAANFKDGSDNDSIRSVFGRGVPISLPLGSAAKVLVVPTNEEVVVARACRTLLAG